ncbi:MAG: hypothetical protein OHK0039_12390 [Bacteroidia bacterium]
MILTGVAVLAFAAIIYALFRAANLFPTTDAEATTEFFFSPALDNHFENPDNWIPAYPGVRIGKDTTVIIQGASYITRYDVNIEGTLRIMMDATLYVSDAKMAVAQAGEILNDGELLADSIENRGSVINRLGAKLDVHDYAAFSGSFTDNRQGSVFIVSRNLVNDGSFVNQGLCRVEQSFENTASFRQSPRAEFILQGAPVTPDQLDSP